MSEPERKPNPELFREFLFFQYEEHLISKRKNALNRMIHLCEEITNDPYNEEIERNRSITTKEYRQVRRELEVIFDCDIDQFFIEVLGGLFKDA